MESVPAARRAIRFVAITEAFKGILVLVAAAGLLSLLHRDLESLAYELVAHAHLNPASRYPRIFIDAAANLQDSRLLSLAFGAAAYSAIRLIEAYGLFRELAWAEWLAALSGAIYLPFELSHLVKHPSFASVAVLVTNLVVVGIMVNALLRRRQAARAA